MLFSTEREIMKLEWYWRFASWMILMFPICAAVHIAGQWLGFFSSWSALDYLIAPLILSVVMTYHATRRTR